MKSPLQIILSLCLALNLGSAQNYGQHKDQAILQFNFNEQVKSGDYAFEGENYSFVKGIDGQALSIHPSNEFTHLSLDKLSFDNTKDFTVQFWVRTTSDKPTTILSQKDFSNKGIKAQQNAGWALYSSGGTFAWAIGSGNRRLNYERDNGQIMPLNDGLWHQLTMTYSKDLSEIRLYYDGRNKAIYKVGFNFESDQPLIIGSTKDTFNYDQQLHPDIIKGAIHLQTMVDAFNTLEIENVQEDEFISLIVNPKALYFRKLNLDESKADLIRQQKVVKLDPVYSARDLLSSNPYTVFQNKKLTNLKPISKIYALKNGRVVINEFYANRFAMEERLYPSDLAIDELSIWDSALSAAEIQHSYQKYQKSKNNSLGTKLDKLRVGVWNIWHGGKHFNIEDHDWDSRRRIAQMLKEKQVDVILMQETYSSGDFIAAELGYYFATTADWDYCYQGSNISVLSRYPITALEVPDGAEFNNVAVKLAISETQEIYAMSNWYGMSSFPKVYDFHSKRFEDSDVVPILFGGDFNAVPHTDGGDSPASVKLMENGFTDAYRSLYPDIKAFPGHTHQWADRIDQLYYKGKGLKNISTEVISTWHGGFPSDHHLIVSEFELSSSKIMHSFLW